MFLISPLKLFSFSSYFKFLSGLFGRVEKLLNQKDKIYFKIYDVKTWETNNCNTHIAQYKSNQTIKFGQLIGYNRRNSFLEKS